MGGRSVVDSHLDACLNFQRHFFSGWLLFSSDIALGFLPLFV